MSTVLNDAFFARPPDIVARELLGIRLLVNGCGGFIAETEAYGPDDEASHSFKGLSKTNAAMFGPPGTVYIYRSYGRHWCLNFVCTRASAVLVRALQPSEGLGLMVSRRSALDAPVLCRGPGNLCQALGVTNELDGLRATLPPFSLDAREDETLVVSGPRIGISKAKDRPWRFGVLNSADVSRPFRPLNSTRQFEKTRRVKAPSVFAWSFASLQFFGRRMLKGKVGQSPD